MRKDVEVPMKKQKDTSSRSVMRTDIDASLISFILLCVQVEIGYAQEKNADDMDKNDCRSIENEYAQEKNEGDVDKKDV